MQVLPLTSLHSTYTRRYRDALGTLVQQIVPESPFCSFNYGSFDGRRQEAAYVESSHGTTKLTTPSREGKCHKVQAGPGVPACAIFPFPVEHGSSLGSLVCFCLIGGRSLLSETVSSPLPSLHAPICKSRGRITQDEPAIMLSLQRNNRPRPPHMAIVSEHGTGLISVDCVARHNLENPPC